MSRTCLALDTPEARQALLRCYTLLLCLAERRQKKIVDPSGVGEQTQDDGDSVLSAEAERNEEIPV